MRILLLTSSLSVGGAERVACTLANAWALRGNEVVLMPTFSGRGECFYELSPDVRLEYLADRVLSGERSFANQFARLLALRRFIAKEKPTVIVSFLSNVNVATVIASAGLNIPLVICERTDPFVCPTPRALELARRFVYSYADVLMVQTQAVMSKYATSKLALPRIWMIPNPVPHQILGMIRQPPIAEKKQLLAVGRLSGEKQFDLLIRVFAILSQRHTDWSLRIVGEGSARSELQQQIATFGLESSIELPGRTANIGDELVKADAFVLTSRFEGFPNSLLEAMATGLPCVTFDCPSGPREISMDGQAALLVAPNDEPALELALERLMSDVNLRRTLGSQARTSVLERFSLEGVLEKWDSLFEAIGVQR